MPRKMIKPDNQSGTSATPEAYVAILEVLGRIADTNTMSSGEVICLDDLDQQIAANAFRLVVDETVFRATASSDPWRVVSCLERSLRSLLEAESQRPTDTAHDHLNDQTKVISAVQTLSLVSAIQHGVLGGAESLAESNAVRMAIGHAISGDWWVVCQAGLLLDLAWRLYVKGDSWDRNAPAVVAGAILDGVRSAAGEDVASQLLEEMRRELNFNERIAFSAEQAVEVVTFLRDTIATTLVAPAEYDGVHLSLALDGYGIDYQLGLQARCLVDAGVDPWRILGLLRQRLCEELSRRDENTSENNAVAALRCLALVDPIVSGVLDVTSDATREDVVDEMGEQLLWLGVEAAALVDMAIQLKRRDYPARQVVQHAAVVVAAGINRWAGGASTLLDLSERLKRLRPVTETASRQRGAKRPTTRTTAAA